MMPHAGGYLVIFEPFGNINVLHGSCVEHLLTYHLVPVIVVCCYLQHFAL